MSDDRGSTEGSRDPALTRVRQGLRRNAAAILTAVAATVLVQLSVWAFAVRRMPAADAAALTLLASVLWVFIAAPIFAAGGRTGLEGLFRGGSVIDASIVLLVVLAVRGRPLQWMGAVKVYLILAAVGLTQCALVWTAGSARARHVLAAAAVLLVLAVSAGPFWANGAIMAAPGPWRDRIGYAVVAANPVFAFAGCLPKGSFIWHQKPLLYEFTVLGRDSPMHPAAWYVTVMVYAVLAAAVAAAAVARRAGKTPSH